MELLKYGWKFIKSEEKGLEKVDVDDSSWREVRVPHDYAIEGPFAKENDSQLVGIEADGIKKAINNVGRTGGLPINDHAWYRRKVNIDKKTKRAFLEFDGIMCNSSVYINGKYIGGRPYGYSTFCLEITDCMTVGENILAVECSPEPCASRWYTGAGIYRNVRLRECGEICLDFYSNIIKYKFSGKDSVEVHNLTKLSNPENENVSVVTTITDKDGNTVARAQSNTFDNSVEQSLPVNNVIRWDIENPYLYNVTVDIVKNDIVLDSKTIKYGFREILFSNEGFFLNGRRVPINGVCMHHDFGPLGAAVNLDALTRQLEILKSFGTNAVRTSHNPSTPELLDLCDEMGILVMDEAFDEWEKTKVINGYAKYFKEWSERDLSELIYRDMNHSCVFMWSVGNEIPEQWRSNGGAVCERLVKIVKAIDTSRPVTCGLNGPKFAIRNGFADSLDILGLNYKAKSYRRMHKRNPNHIYLGSETASCVSTRGEYYLPAKKDVPVKKTKSLLLSSYDNSAPDWAYPPDTEFYYLDKCPFIAGEFAWTGFDYLGEPTPFYNNWPCRSSYFGIVDLVGMPKDRYYSYKSRWKKDEPILHIFPHWNWNRGDKVDVHCYSSFDSVELFLNGRSLGIKTKKDKCGKQHRLVWKKVKFEEGELVAVSTQDRTVTDRVITAGEPYELRLTPEKSVISADGDSLAYIRCDVVDKKGVICPRANINVDISVSGAGEYLASDNGRQCSDRIFSEPYCDTLNGSMMIIVRSILGKTGKINIAVKADGLVSEPCIIETK